MQQIVHTSLIVIMIFCVLFFFIQNLLELNKKLLERISK